MSGGQVLPNAATAGCGWARQRSGPARERARSRLGIGRNTVPPRGGNISHDPKTGEPAGCIQEMPGVWLSAIPPPSYEVREQSVAEVMQDFMKKGALAPALPNHPQRNRLSFSAVRHQLWPAYRLW